jgi:LDH2 family malate/lactate/ureidoglycolate dehydrogenase
MGLAAISLRNAGHVGRVGEWAERAAAAGLISKAALSRAIRQDFIFGKARLTTTHRLSMPSPRR